MIVIGIDPGWASFGLAISKDGKLLDKYSFVPKEYGTIADFILVLNNCIQKTIPSETPEPREYRVYIERFVTYGGIQTDPENILMLIGALDYFFSKEYSKPILVKALDWKVKMCHYLVKTKGLSNPYSNFNKKYSIWAAENLSNIKLNSDHEADAICLSYLTEAILGNKSK